MIPEFPLKLKRLDVGQIEKTLMLKKYQKMAQAMLDFHEFSLMQNQNQSTQQQEQRVKETLLSTFTEGDRKSARPKFLSGQ